MELLTQATKAMIQSNTSQPITRIISEMNFTLGQLCTYQDLIVKYDKTLLQSFKLHLPTSEKIVLIQVEMQPESMYWIIWKNFREIHKFLEEIQREIEIMSSVSQFRVNKNGIDNSQEVATEHRILWEEFQRGPNNFSPALVHRFIGFLNQLGEHMFLRKTVVFLTFVGHCVSIDKWPILIHQQCYMYKQKSLGSKITGLFKKTQETTRSVDKFITITNDGILISDDHLMLSRVRKMIPFTNQMKIKCYLSSEQEFIYQLESGKIDKVMLNFQHDATGVINFGCGLGRALKYSGYNFLMGLETDPQNLGYQQNQYDNYGNSVNTGQLQYMKLNTNLTNNRFESYAQVRESNSVKMYNDGCGYYEDLYNQLMKAEKQVCITGWMITPYFLLKRPGNINEQEYRLDGVLYRLASRGVKIFIIVFMEPALFVNNDSEHVQKHLESLHKNIKVRRHPNVAVPQLWSHHEKLVVIDQKIGFMGGLDICYGRWDTPQHRLVEQESNPNRRLWDGCQFNNYRLKDIYTPRVFWESNLNKDFQPRMPWHDIAAQIRGDVVIDLLRHFVQYWYFVKTELSTDPRRLFSLLQKRLTAANSYYQKVEKQYILNQMKNDTEQTFAMKFNSFKEKIGVFMTGQEQRLTQMLIEQRSGQNAGDTQIQMLRSASQWSIGLDMNKYEHSIHNAYQNLITNAEDFIYIQNQFFMGLENTIVALLSNRIIKAKKENKTFRVIVVMPLLPGFEGDITDPASTVLRIQVHWQFQAINRGKNSLHKRLFEAGFSRQEIDNYIFFFGLRQGGVLHGVPLTQIIYVHSKLMIVDDKRTIIGSANINDRSLLGNRDSQIAICVEENTTKGQSHDLRKRLFDQHFGIKEESKLNIMNEQLWKRLITNAKNNTLIYRDVFACIPDDNVRKAMDLQVFQAAKGDVTKWFSLCPKLVGHAVEFPLDFMADEDLTFKPSQKEFYAPDHSFT